MALTKFSVIVLSAFILCSCIVRIPIWQITQEGTDQSVQWVNADNARFAIYDPGTPEDVTDDAVLDKETGLVWERSPYRSTVDSWSAAMTHCYQTELANRYGWRVPTIEELASLYELPAGHPFYIDGWLPIHTWSSTSYVVDDSAAWAVSFKGLDVGPPQKSAKNYVWCVRGGQGYVAY